MHGVCNSLFLLLCHAVMVAASPFSYVSGPFTILYDETQTPTLRVLRGERAVWYTSTSNGTFVTAARVEEAVKQNGGTFIFDTRVLEVCSDMKIIKNGSRLPKDGANAQVRLL